MSAEDIVRALAEANPCWCDDYTVGETTCALCDANTPGSAEEHEPSCPWRLAVEWVKGGATHLPSLKAGGIIPRPAQLGIDYQVGERVRASVNGEHCEMEIVAIDGPTLRLKRVEP